MVDKAALREAWHDYWEHPEWSSAYIAQRHGIHEHGMYSAFRRAGYVVRRGRESPWWSKSIRLDASKCAGYQAGFCAYCPCPPPCAEWACYHCHQSPECACTNEGLRPPGWQAALDKHRQERQRNRRAVEKYRYAWNSPDEPTEEI